MVRVPSFDAMTASGGSVLLQNLGSLRFLPSFASLTSIKGTLEISVRVPLLRFLFSVRVASADLSQCVPSSGKQSSPSLQTIVGCFGALRTITSDLTIQVGLARAPLLKRCCCRLLHSPAVHLLNSLHRACADC